MSADVRTHDGVRLMVTLAARAAPGLPWYGHGLPTGPSLPETRDDMPCGVVTWSPAPHHDGSSALIRLRVDVSIYAAGFAQADEVYRPLASRLFAMKSTLVDGWRVHNLRQTAGPLQRVDPEAYWRSVLSTWEIRTNREA